MITLRLDPELEKEVRLVAENFGLTKSDLIRKSIIEYLRKLESPNAWEGGKDLFGKYSSGLENLSSNRKRLVKEKIKAKTG